MKDFFKSEIEECGLFTEEEIGIINNNFDMYFKIFLLGAMDC